MPKKKIEGVVRVKVFSVIQDAIGRGVEFGYRHAHKHTDAPGEDEIVDQVTQCVMNELCEVLDFGDEP